MCDALCVRILSVCMPAAAAEFSCLVDCMVRCSMACMTSNRTLLCSPFNYPVNLCVSKMAPALMAGNTLVVKPPTQGAAAGAHMMQCFHKAGFPKGVINFVTGGAVSGQGASASKQ